MKTGRLYLFSSLSLIFCSLSLSSLIYMLYYIYIFIFP